MNEEERRKKNIEYQKKYRANKKNLIKKRKETNDLTDIKYYLENKDKIKGYVEKQYYLNLIEDNKKKTTEIL